MENATRPRITTPIEPDADLIVWYPWMTGKAAAVITSLLKADVDTIDRQMAREWLDDYQARIPS